MQSGSDTIARERMLETAQIAHLQDLCTRDEAQTLAANQIAFLAYRSNLLGEDSCDCASVHQRKSLDSNSYRKKSEKLGLSQGVVECFALLPADRWRCSDTKLKYLG